MLDVAVDDDVEVFEKGIVAQRIDVVYVEEELCKVGQCMFFGVGPWPVKSQRRKSCNICSMILPKNVDEGATSS